MNKFTYFGETKFDLTNDTVTPETLAEGVTAHNAAGDAITGIAPTNINANTSTTLTGYLAGSNGKVTGAAGMQGQLAGYGVDGAATAVTPDAAPTENSANPVTSGGVYDAIAAAVDNVYHSLALAATTKAQVDGLFTQWWHEVYTPGADKAKMLDRWFGSVLTDNRVHGAKLPLFATSQSSTGELTGDSAGLVCEPSTASAAGRDDFAALPQFWILEASCEKNADGTVTVYAVQHIDPLETVRGGEHLCMVLTKNTYFKEWQAGGYHYYQQQCGYFDGAQLWAPKNLQGVSYHFAAWPKYMAGYNASGGVTCGTGLEPVNRMSLNAGITLWRNRSAMYAGGSYRTAKWQLAMFALKYARKGNSGLIEGCTSYSIQYTAAVGETGVERVILTTAQGANLLAGSAVQVGDNTGGTDRGTAATYNICQRKRITAIETVTIDGTDYAAVSIDNGGVTFDTVAGVTLLSTSPYCSGYNDGVLGNDGSRTSATNGKEPGLIQGTEFGIGAYQIVADELLNWSRDAANNYLLDACLCDGQENAGGALNAHYAKVDGATLTFDESGANGWQYIQDMLPCGTNWPQALGGGAGSSNGERAALYVVRGSGVRASWGFGYLNIGGYGGLAARVSNIGPGSAVWNGALGVPSVTG